MSSLSAPAQVYNWFPVTLKKVVCTIDSETGIPEFENTDMIIQVEAAWLCLGNWVLKAFFSYTSKMNIPVYNHLAFSDVFLAEDINNASPASGVKAIHHGSPGITGLTEPRHSLTVSISHIHFPTNLIKKICVLPQSMPLLILFGATAIEGEVDGQPDVHGTSDNKDLQNGGGSGSDGNGLEGSD
ncbi:hypothetical protein B0H10DRAFT_1946269 [Mycena sp. CBHHK59/15]|nr:hypothetical protein B0H10DRAFT_1946269 [Mycena sp. CBHHK59/15]